MRKAAVGLAAVVTVLPAPAWADRPDPAQPLPARIVLGESRKGAPIVATRQGPADAKRVLLVLGQMHGDEPYGRYVVDKVRALEPRAGTAIWTIRTMNPDGAEQRTRRNAARVDLNRNFPDRWLRGRPGSLYYSGPRAASEPETKAFMAGMELIAPDGIVSYHQRANLIDRGRFDKTRRWVFRLSRDLRLPVRRISCVTPCAGTMTGWFNRYFPGWAVTVELPARISGARQRAMARAMVRLAPDLKPTADRSLPEPTPTPTPTLPPTTPTPTTSPVPAPAA